MTLKKKLYEKPPPIEHRVTVFQNPYYWEWACTCGDWSFMEWEKFGDALWWARLHRGAS